MRARIAISVLGVLMLQGCGLQKAMEQRDASKAAYENCIATAKDLNQCNALAIKFQIDQADIDRRQQALNSLGKMNNNTPSNNNMTCMANGPFLNCH